jgi:hypothetical protein
VKPGELLALTLWRPWAWPVVTGGKRIENRSWPPPSDLIGKRIAIHAGERWDAEGERFLRDHGIALPDHQSKHVAGSIVGVVTVVGRLWQWEIDDVAERNKVDAAEACRYRLSTLGFAADQVPLYFGPCGWLLADARQLAAPVKATGKQRLWRVPPAAAAQVFAQL